MLDNLKKYKVILASNSPRRKELLAGLGVDYEVRTLPDVDESYPDTLQGADIPLYIAKEKADAYRNMLQPGELMITADTIVWLDGRVLGKPKDREDALCMLRDMSGRTHEVFTGVCITTTEWQRSFAAQTEVRFAELSEEEITYYVDKSSRWIKPVPMGCRNGLALSGWRIFREAIIILWGCRCSGFIRSLSRFESVISRTEIDNVFLMVGCS